MGGRSGLVRVVAAVLVAVGLGSLGGCARSTGGLTDVRSCPADELGADGSDGSDGGFSGPGGVTFSCGDLAVPLDHGLLPGPRRSGQLSLQVATADNVDAPRGVLVWLVGGPGTPGVRLTAEIARQFDPEVLRQYRLVLVSSRGTGAGALRCPDMQRTVGGSDLAVPPPDAVAACAGSLGDDRRFFATADTVADLDALRQALGARTLSLDGASYGSFVAARYAIAHPDRVARLVLDSVVPHEGLDPLEIAAFPRTADVLHMACRETDCPTDPAQELAQVVRTRHDGVQLLDTLTALTSGKPELAGMLAALHAAAAGNYTGLDAIVDHERPDGTLPPEDQSQGLHTATLCQDLHGPWPDAATPVPERAPALARTMAALPDQAFFPYDRDTATGNGQTLTCQQWPATPVVPYRAGVDLPPVPTLLLAGDHDLNTPLAWTQQEAARAPRGRLVVVPGSGHITQDVANGPGGRTAVTGFLLGR